MNTPSTELTPVTVTITFTLNLPLAAEPPSSGSDSAFHRRAVTYEMVIVAMGGKRGERLSKVVGAIAKQYDLGLSTVWRALKKDSGYLSQHFAYSDDGLIARAGGEFARK